MKKISTLLFVVISLGASAQKTLVHYWNFNPVITATAPTGDTALAKNPTISLVNGASLKYEGSYTDLVTDAGDTTNLRIAETDPTLEMSFRCRSPYGPLTMNLPTTGYQNIVVKYGLFRSGSGSAFNTVTYTTDGMTWDSVGLKITDGAIATTTGLGSYSVNALASPLDLITLDFTNIPAANNNPNFKIRITYNTAAAGNNRYDNLSLDGDPTTLPLSLQSFSGSIVNNQVSLNWNTLNEVNAKSFSIESSTNKISFTSLGVVSAKNIVGLNAYSFQTNAPSATTYYRLKITDKNGTVSYSSIVVLSTAYAKAISVFPNPAVNSITLSHGQAAICATVNVINAIGQVVATTSVLKGATQTTLDVCRLAKGSYIVSFVNNGKTETTQLVK